MSGRRAFFLLFVASLFMFIPVLMDASAHTQVTSPAKMLPAFGNTETGTPAQNAPAVVYDEQLGTTFTQSFTAMAYNVTAVAQNDSDGYGPAYLLDGLSNAGYWYQVGLSYHWPYTGNNGTSGYIQGFALNYETFNTKGQSIFPSNGGGGIVNFTGTINSGDTVLLRLYFSGGNVVMSAADQETGASASVSFSAEGATTFTGSTQSVANSNGFFTGLMTEWYHVDAYTGNEGQVTYSDPSVTLTSGWLWMDEFNTNNGQVVFSTFDSSPVSYSPPSQLQEFSSNGATEYANAYEFITGQQSGSTLTVSYSVQGGGTGYSAPVLNYVLGGEEKTATLTTTPTQYQVDAGSSWSVSQDLSGSGSTERWTTGQQTSGTISSSQTIALVYYNQYSVTFGFTVNGGSGYTSPGVTYSYLGTTQSTPTGAAVWVDAGSSYNYTNPLTGSTSTQRWSSTSPSGTIKSTGNLAAVYYEQNDVSTNIETEGGGAPSGFGLNGTTYGTTSTTEIPSGSSSVWLDTGSKYSLVSSVLSTQKTERWYTQQTVTGTVSSGTSISATYYEQYSIGVDYLVIGGGSGYTPPTLTYTSLGTSQNTPLAANVTDYWVDAGSKIGFPSALPGSTASERWEGLSGENTTVSSPGEYAVDYYHQYLVGFDYSVRGGAAATAPTVGFTQFGKTSSGEANSSSWVDAGTEYSYPGTLSGSSQTERWFLPTGNGTISSAESIDSIYYHEYLVTVSYSFKGAAPQPPALFYTSEGGTGTITLNSTSTVGIWVNSGSQYSMTNPILGANGQERWEAASGVNGTISSATTISPVYFQQFLITASYSISGGGSPGAPRLNGTSLGRPLSVELGASGSPLWLDAGSSYSVSQLLPSSTSGEQWVGDSAVNGVVSGPASVAPAYQNQYYVSLRADPNSGGSISTSSSWFDAGSSVSASATPDQGWAFEMWQGNDQGFTNSGAVQFSVNSPVNETAIFYPGLEIAGGSSASVSYSYGTVSGTVPAGGSSVVYAPQGSEITLRANPTSFLYSFDGWRGASSSTASTIALSITGPLDVEASSGYNYLNIGAILSVGILVVLGMAVLLLRSRR